MKQKEWLYSIKTVSLFTVLFAAVVFYSCNRVNEVEVRVIDVESKVGIEGIKVFYGEQQYTTDENGKVTIEGHFMKGREVTTFLSIKGYTTPDSHNTCEIEQAYKIESSILIIPLRKLKVLELTFASNEDRKGCLVVNDIEKCNSFLDIYYEFSNGQLIYPTDFKKNGNSISMYMNTPPEYWKLEFYNSVYCSGIEGIQPDYTELVTFDSTQDTTFYSIDLR